MNQIEEVCDAVSNGTMPPRSYRLMHPEARLSAQDIDAFCSWADTVSNLIPKNDARRQIVTIWKILLN